MLILWDLLFCAGFELEETQEEAAAAYDMAAIEYRGLNAVTNFDISNYIDKIKKKNDQSQETQTQTQTHTQTAPISSTESEEAEVLQESTPSSQPQGNNVQKEEQQPQAQHTQVAIMDPVLEQDLPWSFMDTEFSDFQVLDIGFSKDGDMHDIFHGEGLEDDINLLCRPDPDESDFNLNTVFGGPCYGDMVGAAESMADKQRLLSSASSSPSSSSSWVSCNYNI